MKRNVLISCIGVVVILSMLAGCGGKKYADVLKVNKEYIDSIESYIKDVEKAEDATDIAKAINRFGDKLDKSMSIMTEQEKKYPELKDGDNLPDEVKESNNEMMAMTRKLGEPYNKINLYMDDPEVKKAQERLIEIFRKYIAMI